MGPSFAGPIIRIRFSPPASLRYPPTLCDAAWRITPADVGRSRTSSCSTGHRRDVDRGGGWPKLRLLIKDDSAQGEGISRAAGPCPQAPASEYPDLPSDPSRERASFSILVGSMHW